jgi:hypothetical protein
VENIDGRLHDHPVLVGQHPLQGGHEPVPTKLAVEVGPVLELEGEGVGTGLLEEVGKFSVAALRYRVVF